MPYELDLGLSAGIVPWRDDHLLDQGPRCFQRLGAVAGRQGGPQVGNPAGVDRGKARMERRRGRRFPVSLGLQHGLPRFQLFQALLHARGLQPIGDGLDEVPDLRLDGAEFPGAHSCTGRCLGRQPVPFRDEPLAEALQGLRPHQLRAQRGEDTGFQNLSAHGARVATATAVPRRATPEEILAEHGEPAATTPADHLAGQQVPWAPAIPIRPCR